LVQGAYADWPLQTWNRGSQTAPAFGASDTIAAYVYPGQSQAQLFAPAVSWYTAGDTQTGYGQGQVMVSMTAAQSATLEAGGRYTLIVWWTGFGTSKTAPVWRGEIAVEPAAGTSTQLVAPYCQLSDLLQYAPWIRTLQDQDSDQESFYSQRLQARQWLDWAIENCYRGASVGNFEYASTLAFAFGGGVGWRRGVGPSPSMVTWLEEDLLIVRPQIVEASAYKAISQIGLAQIGLNNQQAAFGAYYRDMAERVLVATTAEIDLNSDGVGEIFVSLGSTNTLFT
jgi:hypothetical protein